ncbi:MAG: FHA domain-containing protein [Clostridia bacterium]|jgi:pSer/pThr/pTyr-binding forkhead associated (FHA) protein|nr:FHA domain-containing protein [Clostridia bacterium]MDH7572112.1 FHA domain-containing protein [Clostridia bacterium]
MALLDVLITALRYLFLVLLYWFLAQIIRAAWQDLHRAKEGTGPTEGPPGARLVVLDPTGKKGPVFSLKEYVTIGRDPHNDIVLPAPTVSARHAVLVRRGQDYWVQDAGSTNGTYINGVRLRGPARISAGDRITLGDTTLKFLG